jgi:hypothetical protein
MKHVAMIIVLMTCSCIISISPYAQAPHAGIYVHALYAAPFDSHTGDFYNGGGGGEAGILAGKKSTRFTGSLGYSRFFAEDDMNPLGDETFIPVKVGLRQYLPLTFNFVFLQADAGIGFIRHAHTDDTNSPFTYDLQGGVKFAAFEATIGWDTFHVNDATGAGWSSWFTVKAGINFGF